MPAHPLTPGEDRGIGDGRAARGKQYKLAALLMLLVLAKLAGMRSLLGPSDWMQDQGAWFREHLHLSWKRMPCANTSSGSSLIWEYRPLHPRESLHA
jgi:DDE_Tnp_1-associated